MSVPDKSIPDFKSGEQLLAEDLQALKETAMNPPIRFGKGFRVASLLGGGMAVTLDVPPQRGREWFHARIIGSTQDGSNKRWTYDFSEVEKTTAGFDGWTVKSGGRTEADGIAYNLTEDMNGASGLYGNGVASADLEGTLDIQPAPPDLVVRLYPMTIEGVVEFWFEYANGVTGDCA